MLSDSSGDIVHGPMLGNATGCTMGFWLRLAEEARVLVEVSGGGKKIESPTQWATGINDFVVKLYVEGLEPRSEYSYQILVDGTQKAEGKFRTLPEGQAPGKFSVAFGGGAGYTPPYERIWTTIERSNPDALLLLGDNVYSDCPEQPTVQRYCYYRRQSRPEWRSLVSKTPVFQIWDDHDFGVNDCHGGPEIEKPAWKRVWTTTSQSPSL